jgi:hypothetical protein
MCGTDLTDAAFLQNAWLTPANPRVSPWAGMRRPVRAIFESSDLNALENKIKRRRRSEK